MGFGAFCPLPFRLGGSSEEGLTAAQHARLCADLVAVKRTVPLAVFTYNPTGNAITNYLGVNGFGSTFAPTPTWTNTGRIGFNWPTHSFEDPYEIVQPFAVRHATATVHSTVGEYAEVIIAGGTYQFQVHTKLHDGTYVDRKFTVVVY